MTKRLPFTDTRPWYRQFWPWFLILLPATVVVASIYTAFIASDGADDLVVDDYYKNGLAINRKLEREQRAQVQGISARLRVHGETVEVLTTGPVADTELRLSLAHPLEADRDFTTILALATPGVYRGRLPSAVAPHWHWTLEQLNEQGWRIDGTVQAADIDDAARD